MVRIMTLAAAAASCAVLLAAGAAVAAPAGRISDAVLFQGQIQLLPELGPKQNDNFFNTGIPTAAANGVGVTLYDFDTAGHEGGGGPAPSDYIYANNGFIYFHSDSEFFLPSPPFNGINPANFVQIKETGNFQDLSRYFLYAPGTFLALSDVPEPAAWSLMILGLGLLGAGLRTRPRGAAA